MRVKTCLRRKKEEHKSGIETNTAYSTSIHIASLKQILELLIKKPMSAGDKSEKENTTAHFLGYKNIPGPSIHTSCICHIQEETMKDFAFPILFSQQIVAKGCNHVVRAVDTPCFC